MKFGKSLVLTLTLSALAGLTSCTNTGTKWSKADHNNMILAANYAMPNLPFQAELEWSELPEEGYVQTSNYTVTMKKPNAATLQKWIDKQAPAEDAAEIGNGQWYFLQEYQGYDVYYIATSDSYDNYCYAYVDTELGSMQIVPFIGEFGGLIEYVNANLTLFNVGTTWETYFGENFPTLNFGTGSTASYANLAWGGPASKFVASEYQGNYFVLRDPNAAYVKAFRKALGDAGWHAYGWERSSGGKNTTIFTKQGLTGGFRFEESASSDETIYWIMIYTDMDDAKYFEGDDTCHPDIDGVVSNTTSKFDSLFQEPFDWVDTRSLDYGDTQPVVTTSFLSMGEPTFIDTIIQYAGLSSLGYEEDKSKEEIIYDENTEPQADEDPEGLLPEGEEGGEGEGEGEGEGQGEEEKTIIAKTRVFTNLDGLVTLEVSGEINADYTAYYGKAVSNYTITIKSTTWLGNAEDFYDFLTAAAVIDVEAPEFTSKGRQGKAETFVVENIDDHAGIYLGYELLAVGQGETWLDYAEELGNTEIAGLSLEGWTQDSVFEEAQEVLKTSGVAEWTSFGERLLLQAAVSLYMAADDENNQYGVDIVLIEWSLFDLEAEAPEAPEGEESIRVLNTTLSIAR